MNALARLSLLAMFVAGSLCAQGARIACVDMEVLFEKYYKTPKASELLDRQKELYKEYAAKQLEDLKQLDTEYKTLVDAATNVALSDAARKEKEQEAQKVGAMINEKRQEIRGYQKDKQRELQQKYEAQRDDLVAEIRVILNKVAEEGGYDLILDISGKTLNQLASVVYHKPEMDITATVLERLNAGQPAE